MVEIGYGVAESRRKRGHATRAVAAMLDHARADPTCFGRRRCHDRVANLASQRALERNGFVRTGTSYDPDDGELVFWWRHDLR